MQSNSTIQWDTSQIETDFFPIITFPQGMLEKTLYTQMKTNFPAFKNFKVTNCGQTHRTNIEIRLNGDTTHRHNLNIIKHKYPAYYKLFQHLHSSDFKQQIFSKFDPILMKQYGFIGHTQQYSILMQICESTGGYENPFHIDSRKRIIHGLLYFGDDDIIQGGELVIAQHKSLPNFIDYPQYPHLADIECIKSYKPTDNTGVFILSTPNSYHKGNATQGRRRFLYISIDYIGGNKIAWPCGWVKHPTPFQTGLITQKQQPQYNILQNSIDT